MQHENLKLNTYKISEDASLLDKENGLTPEIRKIIEEIFPDVVKGRKYLIHKLNKLCEKYPNVPAFKNLLSNVHQHNGNLEKAYAINKWLVKEHPDYLFGKVNLATELIYKNDTDKIPEILGENLEIGELYPHRNEFYFEEVIMFNTVVVEYFMAIGDLEKAEKRVKAMLDIDAEHPKTLYAVQLLQNWYLNETVSRLKLEDELIQNVPLKDNKSHLQTKDSPEFYFSEEISWLYNNDLSIRHEAIEKILQLDPVKLTEDLEKVLHDSIARYDFFAEKVENEGFDYHKLDFPIHALFLLSELKSEKSLPAILELLKQDDDFNELWFGDFINDAFNNALYYCGKNQPKLLFEFLKLPNIFEVNKAIVGESLMEIIADSNRERSFFVEQYREVLKVFIENADDENYVDTEAIGFIISDIIDLGYKELLPEIKQLFDLEIVGFWICGDYESVEEGIQEPNPRQSLEFIKKDIYGKYLELIINEEKASVPKDDDYDMDFYNQGLSKSTLQNEINDKPIVKPKKIGRNDPCPCGSGKKIQKVLYRIAFTALHPAYLKTQRNILIGSLCT